MIKKKEKSTVVLRRQGQCMRLVCWLFSVFFNTYEGVKHYRVQVLYDIMQQGCVINMTIEAKKISWYSLYVYNSQEKFSIDALMVHLLNSIKNNTDEYCEDIIRKSLPVFIEENYNEEEHKRIWLLANGV